MNNAVLFALLSAAWIIYLAIGCMVISTLDEKGVLLRWYQSFHGPLGLLVHMLFWAAWPFFAARLFIHQASPHHNREREP